MSSCTAASATANKGSCPSVPTGLSAKQACEQVQSKASALQGMENTIKDFTWAGIIDAFKPKSKATQRLRQIISNKDVLDTLIKQTGVCDNAQQNEQTNSVTAEGTAACIAAYKAAGLSPSQISEAMSATNITQDNEVDASQQCGINQMLGALSNLSASVDNSAVQKTLNQAKGMSTASSAQNECQYISNQVDSCKYLQQMQCCSNSEDDKQDNHVDANCAEVKGAHQTNKLESFQSCTMTTQSKITQNVAQAITNASGQSAVDSAKSDHVVVTIVICIVIAMALGLACYAVRYFHGRGGGGGGAGGAAGGVAGGGGGGGGGGEVAGAGGAGAGAGGGGGGGGGSNRAAECGVALGVVGVAAGAVMCAVGAHKGKPKEVPARTVYNSPLATNSGARAVVASSERTTLGRAEQTLQSDPSQLVAFDFFPDSTGGNPQALASSTTGLATFYSAIDGNASAAAWTNGPLVDPKQECVSYADAHKARPKKGSGVALVFGGATLIVCSAVLALYCGHLMTSTRSSDRHDTRRQEDEPTRGGENERVSEQRRAEVNARREEVDDDVSQVREERRLRQLGDPRERNP